MFNTFTDYIAYFLMITTGGLSAVCWSELVSLYKRHKKAKKGKQDNDKTDS